MKVSEVDACECYNCGRELDRERIIERYGDEIPEGMVFVCDSCDVLDRYSGGSDE